MTVAELIAQLQRVPETALIAVHDTDEDTKKNIIDMEWYVNEHKIFLLVGQKQK